MIKKVSFLVLSIMVTLSAQVFAAENLHDLQYKVGVDKVAHFSCSYIIRDQLERNCKFSPGMAIVTTLFLGYAKERWVDDHFDHGDMNADIAGTLFYSVKF